MTTKTAHDVAAECRAIADALEALPDGTPLPTHVNVWMHDMTPALKWLLFENDVEAQADTARAVMQAIGGDWVPNLMVELFVFRRTFHGVQLEVTVSREVTYRRVVDGETVNWEYQPLAVSA